MNFKRESVSILLPDLRGGGAERVAVNLANSFVQRGQSVDMVLLSATGEFLSELDPRVRVVDLKVRRARWAVISARALPADLPAGRIARLHVASDRDWQCGRARWLARADASGGGRAHHVVAVRVA